MRLIDATQLILSATNDKFVTMEEIIRASTVNAEFVVHGMWVDILDAYVSVASKDGSYRGHATICSICHEVNPSAYKTNYCPNCGAQMDG